MGRRKMSVLDFTNKVDSEDIPIIVREGPNVVGRFRSLRELGSHGMPGILEANIQDVTIGRDEIVIRIKFKSFCVG